jgi:protein involved in polysaccharide export with SLBB domain
MRQTFTFLAVFLYSTISFTQNFPLDFNPANLLKLNQDSVKKELTPTPSKDIVEKTTVIAKKAPQKSKPVATKFKSPRYFGGSFYHNKDLIIKNDKFTSVPKNYLIGSDDEISISIWGFTQLNENFRVGKDGSISANIVGKIFLGGLTFHQAEKVIKSKFSKVYNLSKSQMKISLTHSNSIRINIIGEVNKPGTYYVPSINSVFNILSLSKGFTNLSGIRDIQIIRNGRVINTFDLYCYLLDKENKNKDIFLQDNDFIKVRTFTKMVSITGQVLRTDTFQIKDSEGVLDIINFAGGLRRNAFLKQIHISRMENYLEVIKDYNLDSVLNKMKKIDLKDGDRISVSGVKSELTKYVRIEGEITAPGSYDISKNKTLKNLLLSAGNLTGEAYKETIVVKRRNLDLSIKYIYLDGETFLSNNENFILKEKDEVIIYAKSKFTSYFNIQVLGAVREPKTIEFNNDMTLGNAITMCGGLNYYSKANRVEIARLIKKDGIPEGDSASIDVIRLDISDPSSDNLNFELKEYDKIYIRKKNIISPNLIVKLEGEINYPGQYSLIQKGESLKSLIDRSGGLTNFAFKDGGYIKRMKGDSTVHIIINLKKMYSGKKNYNYQLEAGDSIVIPKIDNMVYISGEIEHFNKNKIDVVVPYKEGMRARKYIIENAGGFTKKSDRSSVYVVSPTGQILKVKKKLLVFKRYPQVIVGSRIICDPKPIKIKKKRTAVNWNRVVTNFTSSVTGIVMTWILIVNVAKN